MLLYFCCHNENCFILPLRNESQVIQSLDDVYQIGTFVQIHELQDVGDRLRLVVMAHRRIRILKQIPDVPEEAPEGIVPDLKLSFCFSSLLTISSEF